MTFRFDMIYFQCVFNSDDPVLKYAVMCLTLPACVIAVGIWHGFFQLLLQMYPERRDKDSYTGLTKSRYDLSKFGNVVGSLYTIFFVAVTLNVIDPFLCLSNPSGKYTLQNYPSVVCYESDEYKALLKKNLANKFFGYSGRRNFRKIVYIRL